MNKLSFYDQVGVIIPGAVFLFGMMFCVPGLRDVFAKDGVSIGGLGIFVIISYAIGHLLAALANLIEKLYWNLKGGKPSNWIVGPNPRLLTTAQIVRVEALTASRLGLTSPPFAELTESTWAPIFREIYSDVEKHGKPGRGDTFNGIYGLNRGLCAAALALAVVVVIQAPAQWMISLGLVGVSVVYLYRMQRFGVYYATEIYIQFLLLPPEPGKPKKAKAAGSNQTMAGRPPAPPAN
jgi:hypothetical protein